MGLRFQESLTDKILEGVIAMEESVTYQAILRRGRGDWYERGIEYGHQRGLKEGLQEGIQKGENQGEDRGTIKEARRLVVRIGQKRFQKPIPQEISNRLESITDRDRLESLLDRTLDVSNWDELMPSE